MPKAVDGLKVCSQCKVEKPVELYSKDIRATDGLRGYCRECHSSINKEYSISGRKGVALAKNGFGTYFTLKKKGAKVREVEFNITKEYLTSIPRPEYCPFLGIKLKYFEYTSGNGKVSKGSTAHDSASLDRIDSNKGYVEGNIRWVSNLFNKMKSSLTDQELKEHCKRILEAFEKEEQNAKLCISMPE